jgi:hypothetical protein
LRTLRFDQLNQFLRCLMIREQYRQLEAEAADFFGNTEPARMETQAFEKAALRTFIRD